MQNIMLNVTLDEANLIMEALGEMRFSRVYQLVAKLQQQAAQQLHEAEPAAQVTPFEPSSSAGS